MFMFIIIMVFLNSVALFSLKLTLKQFHVIEICAYWMLICAVVQQVFTIITMNLGMIVISEGVGVFWYLIMNRLILDPTLIIWLFCFSKGKNLVHKSCLTGIWVVVLSGTQLLSKAFGLIAFSHWNFVYSVAEWFVVILISSSFFLWFRHLLMKEGVIV